MGLHRVILVVFATLVIATASRADQIKPDPQSPFSNPNPPITLPPIDLGINPDPANPFTEPFFSERSPAPDTRPSSPAFTTGSTKIDPLETRNRASAAPPSSDVALGDRSQLYNARGTSLKDDDEVISVTALGVLAGGCGLAIIAALFGVYMWWREKNEPVKPIYMEPSPPPRPIPPRKPRHAPGA